MTELKRVTFRILDLETGGKLDALSFFLNQSQQKILEDALEEYWKKNYEQFPKELETLKELHKQNRGKRLD